MESILRKPSDRLLKGLLILVGCTQVLIVLLALLDLYIPG